MGLVKSHGNMYDWVTHMHTHLAGECPHKCTYCYVQKMCRTNKYKGEPRLIEPELDVNYGKGKTIFIEHMSDLFSYGIKDYYRMRILQHCCDYPENTYVFQTKNPSKAFAHILGKDMPEFTFMGTTIETDKYYSDSYSQAPPPEERIEPMIMFKKRRIKTFVTIEPIMDFNICVLPELIKAIQPEFVNIGADSKKFKLPEPPKEKILELIKILQENNITIKKKSNLERLLK